ncbi:right-handed parallel beta-helix repeat-containing protein [Corallococcus carmarthensis]|uniref:Right-handed parallel beta-helix repeat-containing protein n=1 Tax=Corallococcus carmarthensis TaxID=2316728 RepID=A0A3A8KIV0_9BACT|nr:right-handed parallel beta-helix repeat-containing protein [Corallococcus carmarthensis]NOK20617.1 right-handed parallel beta-helix repeat-containing protein [Corallococcus carmarthensis]RKH04131.1 right-handed parallel beta-helix repeat-containing protein [Corallococcus carmarthensis]
MTWPLALLLLAGTAAKASDPEAAETFEARAVRCGDVLTRNTRLTRDLVCPGTPEPALRIAASGVVLDLGGYTVRRSGTGTDDSTGVVAEQGSTVRNGKIRGFYRGYAFDGAPVQVHKVALVDNVIAIYHRNGGGGLLLTDSRLSGNSLGFGSEFDATSGFIDIRGSRFAGNGLVLFVDFHDTRISGSTFTSNENVLYCYSGSIRVRSSTFTGNASVADLTWDNGRFDNCYELVFENSILANNTAFGTPEHPDWQAFDFQMRDSWVMNNGEGLRLAAQTLDVRSNLWWDNAGGLTLSNLPDFEPVPQEGPVRDNRFLSNDGDGLRVLPGSIPTLSRNVCRGNTGWGIHAPTAIDGGGNAARGNGAGGCVGVVCAP